MGYPTIEIVLRNSSFFECNCGRELCPECGDPFAKPDPAEREEVSEDNSTTYRHKRRVLCGCSHCRPHGGENRSRYGKHGKTKPRYKNRRG
jgi:hypothetical protein